MPWLSLEQSCSTLGTNERPNREATMAAVAGRKGKAVLCLDSFKSFFSFQNRESFT